MIYLILAVVCGSLFSILFKLFQRHGVNTMQAILYNYITGFLISVIPIINILVEKNPEILDDCSLPAMGYLMGGVLGVIFMLGFIVMDRSTWRCGVALTTVTARASLVIPIILSWLWLSQPEPHWTAIIMVITAMLMIIIPNRQEKHEIRKSSSDAVRNRKAAAALIGIFLVYGISDFLLKFAQNIITTSGTGNTVIQLKLLTACIFLMAAVTSFIICITTHAFSDGIKRKDFLSGMVLGLANNLCTTFMLLALGKMATGIFYPMYNVGIVLIATLTGLCFFREKIKIIQIFGILLALAAIVILVTD